MRIIGLRLLTAVTVALASLTVTAPASARPRVVNSVDNGYLDWGVKESFRTFVGHGDGNPPITVKDGAAVNADGTYRFPVTGGTYVPCTGAASIRFGGSVVFSYPAHGFVITLADPALIVNGATRVLKGDVTIIDPSDGTPILRVQRADLATLRSGAPVVNGSTVTWTRIAATLTPAGSEAFAGVYPAGTEMDPVAGTVTTSDR
jgi:hypothetical protein